jgi:ribosomal protein S1
MLKTNEIGDPSLAYLFDEDNFTNANGIKLQKVSDEIMSAYESFEYRIPKRGDVVTATLNSQTEEEFLLSVRGFKDFIRVDNKGSELTHFSDLEMNGEIEVLITHVNNNDFIIKGSVDAIQEQIARDKIARLDKNDFIMATVRSMNPAGYDVEIKQGSVRLSAFMPNTLAGINKLYDPTSIVGDEMEVMIESFSQQEGTYIVSRRKYLRTLIPSETKQLETNTVYDGRVTGTAPFGIFVEFNKCLTGLIHKVNVLDDWKDRLNEIEPGFEIQFYVKEVLSKNKIILTQILRESLWDTIEVGQVIEGTVKDVKPFGALVSLDEETVGLVTSSELRGKKTLTRGDDVKVKVLSADRPSRKISLAIS